MGDYGNGLYGAGIYSDSVIIAVSQDSAWPPRILIEVTNLSPGDQITIYRVFASARTPVRGADSVISDDTAFVINDGEYPFGAPLQYVINVNGSDNDTASITPTLPGGQVAVSDAITGQSVECKILAWPDATSTRTGTRFDIAGRSLFVGQQRAGAEIQAQFMTLSDTTREQTVDLLNNATSGIVLVRVPDITTYPGYDGHYIVLSDVRSLITQNGTDPRRTFTLDLLETDGWAAGLIASGWTLLDIEDSYIGMTLADIEADFTAGALLDIEIRDWGQGAPS